jgi:putative endonuclease
LDHLNRQTGRFGEKMAERFLVSRGFSVRERNYKTPFGEIDMICERDGFLVFFEVKTRLSETFGPPLSSITETKKKHILKNCQFYLKKHRLCETPCRIDVIGLDLYPDGRLKILRHVRNAIELE